jgi:sugar phosphate permease
MSPDPRPPPASENLPPTRVRYGVVAACFLMAVLLYLDRFCVSLAEPYIKQDLGLNTIQVGLFFSAFFWTYALFQVPSGWLSDRYGARAMLALYILAWSLFTGMMGLSTGFLMLLVMRAAYGAGQAGAYPTSAAVISKWVPFSARGTASSLVALGGRFGGALAPALTALLIVAAVPLERESAFQPHELLDAGAFCSRLNSQNGTPGDPAVSHVWSLLPEDARERITAVAAEYAPLAAQRQRLEAEARRLEQRWQLLAARDKAQAASKLTLRLSDDDRRLFVAALNGLIDDEDFFRPGAFDALGNLDRAALDFMQRAAVGETLTDAERRRFHRLLLEATLPDALGRIYVRGWRPVMIVYGLFGVLVAGFYWIVVRDRPEEHPRCNPAERTLISAGRPAGAPQPHGKAARLPWRPLLASRSMWCNCLSQVGTNIGWVFLVTWFPRFLIEEHHVPILERGVMASVPLFVGWLGMTGGGAFTDWLVPRVGLRWGRRLPWSGSRFLAVGAFLACPLLDSPWAVTSALAVVAFATDLGSPSAWAFSQDVGGHYVGSILGWGNMWGNLGAAVSPLLLAWVFEQYGWTEAFWVCAAAFAASGLFALGVDATIPIAPPDEPD